LQKIPGEVLMDMYKESPYLTSANNSSYGGFYSGYIASRGVNPQALIHEVGHSLDDLADKTRLNEFMKEDVFKEEIEQLYASGKCGKYEQGVSESELFAECYRYLMGQSDPKMAPIYEKYLPNTLQKMAQIVKDLKAKPADERSIAAESRAKIENVDSDVLKQLSFEFAEIANKQGKYFNIADVDFNSIQYNDDGTIRSVKISQTKTTQSYISCGEPFVTVTEYIDDNENTLGYTSTFFDEGKQRKFRYHKDGTIDLEYLYDESGKEIGRIKYVPKSDGGYEQIVYDNDKNIISRQVAQDVPKSVQGYIA
jgi:hypothetical protein